MKSEHALSRNYLLEAAVYSLIFPLNAIRYPCKMIANLSWSLPPVLPFLIVFSFDNVRGTKIREKYKVRDTFKIANILRDLRVTVSKLFFISGQMITLCRKRMCFQAISANSIRAYMIVISEYELFFTFNVSNITFYAISFIESVIRRKTRGILLNSRECVKNHVKTQNFVKRYKFEQLSTN